MRLQGRHALVTGGGTGIGAAIAHALAMEGAKLTLVGRRLEKLEAVADTIRGSTPPSDVPELVEGSSFAPSQGRKKEGPSTSSGKPELGERVATATADVTDRAQVDAAFASARATHGRIDILVNNAGAAESAAFSKVTGDAWRRMMAVNLDALFHCSQAALPDLTAAEHGRLITIASTAGLKGYGYTSAYAAAKHGAVGLTRALALEFAATNLTVNAVCPGFTDTGLLLGAVEKIQQKTGRSDAEARSRLAAFNPQGRLVSPQEVAAAVLWLCLPESGSINGQAIAVAGGEVT